MKYLIVKTGNREVPFIFPDDLVHAIMLESIKDYYARTAMLMANGMLGPKSLEEIRSAVVAVAGGDIVLDLSVCSGRSETCGVSARPGDAAHIASYPYTGGIVE